MKTYRVILTIKEVRIWGRHGNTPEEVLASVREDWEEGRTNGDLISAEIVDESVNEENNHAHLH
jgi:hypothetical protein